MIPFLQSPNQAKLIVLKISRLITLGGGDDNEVKEAEGASEFMEMFHVHLFVHLHVCMFYFKFKVY